MSIISAGTTTTTSLVQTGNTDGTLQLQVNGTTPSVTLNTSGAVGVGSVPSFGTAGQVLTSQGSGAAPVWASGGGGSSQWTTSGSNIFYNTGNVGIGTSSPTTRLTIGRVDSSNEGGQIDLCRASDNASAWAIDAFGNTSTPSLRFIDNVAASARMVIDSSGNLGLGTSSPNERLMITSASGNAKVRTDSGANQVYMGWDGADAVAEVATNGSWRVRTSGSFVERLRVNTTGAVILQGGDTAANGVGITFPATQSASSNANTLDDYEEGTWTPSYSSAFTGTYTGSGQIGRYTKVGRLVSATFEIQVSTVSGSGIINLTGLPFTTGSALTYGVVVPLAGNWGTNTPFSVIASGLGTTIFNIKFRSSSNGTIDTGNISVSDLSANAFMRATIVYESAN